MVVRADPVDQAAARLAVILGEEQADVITTYDDNGGYGHPDHIQVHRVGARAAELVGLEQVFQNTINRTALIEGSEAMRDSLPEGIELPDFSAQPDFGKPAEVITHRVDVRDFAGLEAGLDAGPPQPDLRDRLLPDDARRDVRPGLRHRVVHRRRARAGRGIAGRRAVRAHPLMPPATPGSWTHTGYTQQIVFGPGSLRALTGLLRTLGLRRVMLVTTAGRHDSDDGDRVRAAIGRALASTFAEVESHVPVPLVQRAVPAGRGATVSTAS